jgi:SAM-dependent methyltransferase
MVGTYEPFLYDAVTPGSFKGDLEWYRRKARESGGPVLELGAGTGRITLAIAQDGCPVHALDAHPGMLQALRSKLTALPAELQSRVTIVEADMRGFHLGRQFPLIIAPFRAFLHNLTRDDQLACLRTIYDHLRPGGYFCFNVFHPSLEYMAMHSGALAGVWRWMTTHPLPDGGRIVCSDANRYDTIRQVVHSQQRYEVYDADGNLVRTFLHALEVAFLYPADIRQLLEQAGFAEIRISGGFDGRPLESDKDELVVEARRAAGA